MNGSLRVAKVAGIPVEIHWSFLLIFVWLTYTGLSYGMSWNTIWWRSILVIALFVCVIFHEYGHALTAKRFGVHTRDIILFPIGGVARLEKLPEKPLHEFYIAVAGPLVNIVIAIVLSPYFLFYPVSHLFEVKDLEEWFQGPTYFIPLIIFLNITLAIFNLLPAFPMDGGRIFRSLLAIRIGRIKATRIAAIAGQILAIGLLFLAIFGGMGLMVGLIGVFVFFTATQEFKMVKMEHILKSYTAGDLTRTTFSFFPPEAPMAAAINVFQKGIERNFLVINETRRVVGVLDEFVLVDAIKKGKQDTPIEELMNHKFEEITPQENLKDVFDKIRIHQLNILPVLEQGEVIGVIDHEGINKFLQLQISIKKRNRRFSFSKPAKTEEEQTE